MSRTGTDGPADRSGTLVARRANRCATGAPAPPTVRDLALVPPDQAATRRALRVEHARRHADQVVIVAGHAQYQPLSERRLHRSGTPSGAGGRGHVHAHAPALERIAVNRSSCARNGLVLHRLDQPGQVVDEQVDARQALALSGQASHVRLPRPRRAGCCVRHHPAQQPDRPGDAAEVLVAHDGADGRPVVQDPQTAAGEVQRVHVRRAVRVRQHGRDGDGAQQLGLAAARSARHQHVPELGVVQHQRQLGLCPRDVQHADRHLPRLGRHATVSEVDVRSASSPTRSAPSRISRRRASGSSAGSGGSHGRVGAARPDRGTPRRACRPCAPGRCADAAGCAAGPDRSFRAGRGRRTTARRPAPDAPRHLSRAPTQATCTMSAVPWPVRRTQARPGVRRGICAASGLSITSLESSGDAMRRAMRRSVFARILGVTTPCGRCVASNRCMPSERPRWAILTMPSTNSGTSAVSAANSSTQMSRLGGADSGCSRSSWIRSLTP